MFVLIANTSKTMSPEFEQIIIEQQVSNVHLKMYLISFPGWENEQDPILMVFKYSTNVHGNQSRSIHM